MSKYTFSTKIPLSKVLKMLRKLFNTTPPFCICVCRLKHKSFMVCFFSSSQNGIVTVKVWWFWCFGNLEHEEEASTKIKNAFWTLVHIMMGEFLASGMCCVALMIVHLKVVLYGNSFHLETRQHSRPPLGCFEALDLCCRGSRCCLFSFSYLEERPRASLWVRRVVHFPSRINSTRFHHKKIDVSVVTNPNWKGIQNPF